MTTTAPPDIKELLDKAKFEQWLRDRNPSANVGTTRSIDTCPVARYLRANGFPNAWAGPQKIGEDVTGGKSAKTPPWMRHFIQLVDRLPSKGDFVQVRAYQARAILARIG